MSKKPNDINDLDAIEQRRRVRAMLSGSWQPSQPIGSEPPIVEETPLAPDDDEEAVGDEDAIDEAPPQAIDAQPTTSPTIVYVPSTMPLVGRLDLQRRAEPRDLVRLYLASRACAKSRQTAVEGLQRCATAIGADAQTLPWHELRLEHTTAIRAALLAKGYKKATITSALAALRGVMAFAEQLGFLSFDDYRRATKLPPIVGDDLLAGRVLDAEEIARLRAYCAAEAGLYGRFLDATFALLLGVGLRVTEACTLPIAGYDAAARVVRVRRKRSKEAELPVDRRAGAALDAWLRERAAWRSRIDSPLLLLRVQKNDWVNERAPEMSARTLEYVLKVAAADAGVSHLTPHDLRRTFCTLLLDAGVDVITVCRLMSHDDVKTTMRYDRRGAKKMAQAREDVEIW